MIDSTQTFPAQAASSAQTNSRAGFLRNTYLHLAGALLLFTLLTVAIQISPLAVIISQVFFSNVFVTLAVFAGFLLVSNIAQRWSLSDSSRAMQYLGLGAYVVLEAIFFTPIIFIFAQGSPFLLLLAAGGTAVIALMLTLIAFTSGVNFSFLRSFLAIGGLIALGVILLGFVFPALVSSFFFLGLMLLFASASILYETSAVIRDYPTDKYVAASLGLFASIMLLFWYILRIIMELTRS
jgi:FtsH-binding integral membrane protein